jgi:hypothetical protein
VVALVAGCGGGAADPDARPDATPCGTVGDLSEPVEMQVVYRTSDGVAAPLADGAELPLVNPPQGGKVLLVGVRVKNVDLCRSTIQVAMKDLVTGRVAGIERRPVVWRIAADGFAEPSQPQEISDFANVPVCPNANIAQDIDGNPWELEVRFYDKDDHATEQVLTVTPSCAEDLDPTYCMCECSMDFGTACECGGVTDGGLCAPDAGP